MPDERRIRKIKRIGRRERRCTDYGCDMSICRILQGLIRIKRVIQLNTNGVFLY